MKILYLHGWHSPQGGVKPIYLRNHGHFVLNPALPDDDFSTAVAIAQVLFDKHRPDVIVGSSRGGAVAMNIYSGTTPLVLLCPAWKRWGTAKLVVSRTVILHSRKDDEVPFADSEELWRNSHLPPQSLIDVGSNHRLADPESLKAMLYAVEGSISQTPQVNAREYGVPRQFGVGTMLVITTLFALLFAILRAFKAPPLAFGTIGLFSFIIGLGQMLVFKGKRPRRASIIVGICAAVVFWVGYCCWDPPSDGLILVIAGAIPSAIYGAIAGYVVGALIAGIFLVGDKLDSLRRSRAASDGEEDPGTSADG